MDFVKINEGNEPDRGKCPNETDRGKCSKVSMYYVNADSLGNKINELQALANLNNYDIVCVTETMPKGIRDPTLRADHTFTLNGYVCYHLTTGRGVSIYVQKKLKSELHELKTEFSDNLGIKVETSPGYTIFVGCFYRSPNSSVDNNELLLSILDEVNSIQCSFTIIVGDFNLKEIDWPNFCVHTRTDHLAYKVFDKINDLFYDQLVKEPTRHRRGEQPNLLDWVLTNNAELVENLKVGSPLGEKGDHNSIYLDIIIPSNNVYCPEKLNLYKGNYSAMKDYLEKIPWNNLLNNKTCNESWNIFHEHMSTAITRFIPKFKSSYQRNRKIWVDNTVREAIREKNRSWNRYKKCKSPENWEIFTRNRNAANRTVNQAKSKFEFKIAEEIKNNPKQFWHYVKSKSNPNREFPTLVDMEGKTYTDDRGKAELFNEYFSSVFTAEDTSSIPSCGTVTDIELSEVPIDPEIVLKYLQKINISKSAGPDGIHSKILFEVRNEIKIPLSIIFSKSLTEGALPREWKHANVKPIHKKGSKRMPSNYRPVSLTSICCKVNERILRDSMVNHLEANKLLSKHQHGFRSGRSCITQLLEVIEIWTDLIDKGIPYDCIYLDFAKAFDKVPHKRLCSKLKAFGIRGNLLKWLSNFLTNRTQSVVINNISSGSSSVTSGIPQGSVLGPLLFLLYIDDITDGINSVIKIFADDTKVFRALNSPTDSPSLQTDLDKLLAWSKKWQLPFNVSKCKVIHYGPKNSSSSYFIDGTLVQVDHSEKDLGITFDSDMKFTTHLHSIVSKANSRVGILRRNFTDMKPEVFLPIYKAIIRPLLEYGSVIWNPMLLQDKREIEMVQRRATKLVRSISHLSYSERLKFLKLDSLCYRRRRGDMIQVYRIIKSIDNIDTSNFFTLNQDQRTRGHSFKLAKPRANSSLRLNTFSNRVINDWNNLSDLTVNSKSVNVFKTNLKREWLDHPEKYLTDE